MRGPTDRAEAAYGLSAGDRRGPAPCIRLPASIENVGGVLETADTIRVRATACPGTTSSGIRVPGFCSGLGGHYSGLAPCRIRVKRP